ncbi:glycosyltransferase family 2 protein [Tabrizicola sp. BL-A-41-H6]|uniref:glycosyltransferase family 2 protein n=1 Tax=Tabrizicola sp. BL-A-41-H6 TaxID=3421107 RepID=UPI003D663CC4
MKPTVLTVILNWRTPDMTLRAVAAAEVAMAGIDGAIAVVDNDSGDGSFETLSEAFRGHDRVRVVQAGRNGGFGAGNNVGIRLGLPDGSRPTYTYVLNSDAFPEPEAIRILMAHLERHPRAGLAGSLIFGTDGETHRTSFRFPSIASEFEGTARFGPISRLLSRWIVALPEPEQSGPVDWVAGASLLIRDDVLRTIGLFDERFFLYFEETDLCHRAKEAGWDTHYVRESRVLHIGSVSTGMKEWNRTPQYWFDSHWRYFCKRGGRVHAVAATVANVAGGLIYRMRLLVQPTGRRDAPRHLRDMVSHAVRNVGSAIEPSDQAFEPAIKRQAAA